MKRNKQTRLSLVKVTCHACGRHMYVGAPDDDVYALSTPEPPTHECIPSLLSRESSDHAPSLFEAA